NPISRNLNNVMTEFVSSLDTVGNKTGVEYHPILTTSPYSMKVQTPVEVSLLSATAPPDSRLFNQGQITIGIAIEGKIQSVFRNRMTKPLGIEQKEIIAESEQTKMVVIADGGILKNKTRNRNGQIQLLPLGYDQYSGQTFGNRDFILNCIDYLNDDSGIMQLRSRIVKLRMLDKTKIRDWETEVKIMNIAAPIILLLIFGLAFNIIRKIIYTKK
ncbi:MAG: hypothetical protein JW798_07950, partial [Prolixibacteraceae bacterium]|nr:hypothetical protein [Prolixibacteraceae bacterium]